MQPDVDDPLSDYHVWHTNKFPRYELLTSLIFCHTQTENDAYQKAYDMIVFLNRNAGRWAIFLLQVSSDFAKQYTLDHTICSNLIIKSSLVGTINKFLRAYFKCRGNYRKSCFFFITK